MDTHLFPPPPQTRSGRALRVNLYKIWPLPPQYAEPAILFPQLKGLRQTLAGQSGEAGGKYG